MERKRINIFEWIFIGIFLIIVISFASIQIYRSVVNSDWYERNERKKEFQEDVSKLYGEEIKYIESYKATTNATEHFYDVDDSIFSEITCDDYLNTLDELERYSVFSSDRVSVFFEDGSLIDFYITDDLKVYWGKTEIKAPSLVNWYVSIKD